MAIERTGGKKTGGSMEQAFREAGVEQGQPQPQPQQQYQQGQDQGLSYMNIDSILRRPISRSSAGESVLRYNEVLRSILKAETRDLPNDPFRLLVLDSNISMAPLSSILVCHHRSKGGQEHVAVYTLLVESSAGGRLSNRQINIAGQQIEVTTVPGDVYDDIYWSKVHKRVAETANTGAQIHDAGVFVIPSELSVDDEGRLRSVLFNATTALVAVMNSILGSSEPPFSAGWDSSRSTLTARIDYGTANDENPAGLPVRSDISINLQGVVAAGGQSQYEQAKGITKIDGFVDLVYDAQSPQGQQMPPYGWQQQQPPQTQRYYPRFVITDSDSVTNAVTMELQLLGLSTATLLSKGMAWAGVFQPNYGAQGVDLRDIGAVGYEVNLTGDPNAELDRIDTKAESFTQDSLYQLIHMAVHNALIYSMDIEETGALNWITGAFAAAANNDPAARQLIVEAADTLTLGNFSQLFGNEPIAVDDHNRIHLGYYRGADDKRRDIRELDYLAMLNMMGAKDPRVVIEYADTFDRTDVPLEIRLERRLNIMRAVLGESLQIKGFARRITFNPKFIKALEESCAAAGMIVRPSNVAQDFGTLGIRGNLSAGNYAVRDFAGSMFQSGQRNYGQYNQQPSFFGRWGR